MTNHKGRKRLKSKRRKIRIFITICTAVLFLSFTYIMDVCGVWRNIFALTKAGSIYEEGRSYPLSVTVYDAGNANCVLIRYEGYYILIDSGMQKVQNDISDKLKSAGIDRLDLVILSCPDEKYIGSMCKIADNVWIDRFVTCECGSGETSDEYGELLKKLGEKSVPVEYVRSGDKISFGEMDLKIVAPCRQCDSPSDNSLAVRLSFGEFAMLFMGDTSKTSQSDMLDSGEELRCDVMLTARQGRQNSVTDEFLRAADPRDAVISVEQTDYLPDDKVVRRILDYGCSLYRTDYSGNIVIASDGADYSVLTQFK